MEYPVSRIEYIVFQMEYPAYRMKKTRAPLSGNLVLHFGNRVLHLVIGYPIPETRYPFHQQNGSLTKTGYPTRETGFSFILSGYPFRKSGYSIRETRYPILNTGYQLLGTHFRRPAMTNFSNFWRFWAGVQKSLNIVRLIICPSFDIRRNKKKSKNNSLFIIPFR